MRGENQGRNQLIVRRKPLKEEENKAGRINKCDES